MATKPVKITPQEEVPTEILAQEIVALSDGVKKLLGGRLKRRAVIILLQSQCKLPQSSIEAVLDSLENLRKEFVRD